MSARTTRKSAAYRVASSDVWRSAWRCLLLASCLLLSTAESLAQGMPATDGQLWRFTQVDSSWPELPPGDTLAHFAVILDADIREQLQAGAELLADVDPESIRQVPVRILDQTLLVNGDLSFNAQLIDGGEPLPLILTLGSGAVFAYLESEGVVWQLYALQENASAPFKGWVYESKPLDARLQNDYVIPDSTLAIPAAAPSAPPTPAPLQKPLLTAPAAAGVSTSAATSSGIHDGNLRITQQAPAGVLAGSAVTVTVSFANITQERHHNLVADIHFVLEKATLLSASAGCSAHTLRGFPVLSCALGDMGAGATRSVSYTVQTSAESRPYLTSTVAIGNSQQNTFINVAQDVSTDTDQDGISDFNERLLGTDPRAADSVDRSKSIIDVMVLYTADAQSLYGGHAETRTNQLISVANQVFSDSGVDIILRPVFHQLIDYPQQHDMDTMLDSLTYSRDQFAPVPALREKYGADLVILFRPQRGENDRCGLANLGGLGTLGDFSSSNEKNYAYSLVAIDCPVSSVVAHEVGHNLGLTHSHREDGFGGTFPYATGYGVEGRFTTVMAYPGAFNTSTRIARFSSPLLDCNGGPCGMDYRLENGADAVRALNLVRQQVAAYHPLRVPYMPVRLAVSSYGGPTDALIASAASTDEGLSFARQVASGETLDVTATLLIDSRHVGQPGVFHVLLGLADGGYFNYTENGLSQQEWNGTLAGLQPFFPASSPLHTIENLRVLTRLRIDPAFAGNQVHIYLGYQVSATGELIFTPDPLIIDIVR